MGKQSILSLLVSVILVAQGCGGRVDESGQASGGESGAEVEENAKSGGSAAEGAPRAEAVNPSYDFGEVNQGAEVEYVFRIRNTGNADLSILSAKGS